MSKKDLLKMIKKLDDDINFYYWKYYNNFLLSELYNKDIYNSIINWYWNTYLNFKQLKKYYIKNKLELENAIKNNDDILKFSKTFWNYINKICF